MTGGMKYCFNEAIPATISLTGFTLSRLVTTKIG
jgi:hypothetical protein